MFAFEYKKSPTLKCFRTNTIGKKTHYKLAKVKDFKSLGVIGMGYPAVNKNSSI